MPHTQFDIREVSDYLHLSVDAVRDLVKYRDVPHHSRGEEVVFIREEIDAWASQRILGFTGKSLTAYHQRSSSTVHSVSDKHQIIPELMKESYVDASLSSRTRASLLKDLIGLAKQSELVVYPDELERSILERETLASTAMPGGFALVHPRHHDPYMFEDSFIALGRSSAGLPFGAPDGFMTDLFFVVCCQNDRIHLHVLARLCMMCSSTELLHHLRAAEGESDMLEVMFAAEEEVIRYV